MSEKSRIVLSRIYTRTGDSGSTALGDMSRVRKTDSRIEAYAATDEAGAVIGVALASGELSRDVVEVLRRVQNDLFDVGADLSTPLATEYAYPPLRVKEEWIVELEEECDRYNEDLPTLRSFVLAGGSSAAAALHQARTVVRRAERETWRAIEELGEGEGGVSPVVAQYLNRLSDLLFILARVANRGEDVLWVPGGGRES